jgi:hypothetical protein
MYHMIIQILFLALLVFNHAAHSEPAVPQLYVTLPGDVLGIDTPEQEAPPSKLLLRWYAVSLDGRNLRIDPITRTRSPDWTVTSRSTGTTAASGATAISTNAAELVSHALALPDSALLAFRFAEDEPITSSPRIPFGIYPSAVPPFLLTTELQVPAAMGGKDSWILSTEYVRRKDDQLLAGSLALIATRSSAKRLVLVPPAAGMAFIRQEVLWAGRIATSIRALEDSAPPSLLLRRTWVTGEVDYVVVIDGAIGNAYFDPDRAMRSYSSGVMESESFWRHVTQRRQPPSGKFGMAAFTVKAEVWDDSLRRIAETELPETLFDRQLVINAEPVRFTIEYLPRWIAQNQERSSTSDEFFWDGPLLVKVHLRGKSQVLLQLGALESDFRIQLDQLNGELAIEASVRPNYNNEFVYYWVWSEADGRFLRLLRSGSQGC